MALLRSGRRRGRSVATRSEPRHHRCDVAPSGLRRLHRATSGKVQQDDGVWRGAHRGPARLSSCDRERAELGEDPVHIERSGGVDHDQWEREPKRFHQGPKALEVRVGAARVPPPPIAHSLTGNVDSAGAEHLRQGRAGGHHFRLGDPGPQRRVDDRRRAALDRIVPDGDGGSPHSTNPSRGLHRRRRSGRARPRRVRPRRPAAAQGRQPGPSRPWSSQCWAGR